MAKKEKIVDLKSKAEKITDEQLEKIQKMINDINKTQFELGTMELKKHEMMHKIAGSRDELTLMQDELQKEYGTVDVNIQDGTINYPTDVEADS
tara:strand:+ start:228 stop:509 length:282 start_codon:yes stop_codon:yes gene_type:complete